MLLIEPVSAFQDFIKRRTDGGLHGTSIGCGEVLPVPPDDDVPHHGFAGLGGTNGIGEIQNGHRGHVARGDKNRVRLR